MKLVIEAKDVGLEIDLNEVRAAIREHFPEVKKFPNGTSTDELQKWIVENPLALSGINSVQSGTVKKKPGKKPGRKPGRKPKIVVSEQVFNPLVVPNGNGDHQ